MARRFSGALAASTTPVVPLKTAPAPPPMSAPLIKNRARFGVERRTETTRSMRPTSIEIMPSASTREACSLAVINWEATPQENTRKSVAPDSACEGWCSVVARNSPASPANRPLAAKAATSRRLPGRGSRAERAGGRLRRWVWCRRARLGHEPQPGQRDRPERDEHEVGQCQLQLPPLGQKPADHAPIPSPPTVSDVPMSGRAPPTPSDWREA